MCRPLRIRNHFRHLSIYFSTLQQIDMLAHIAHKPKSPKITNSNRRDWARLLLKSVWEKVSPHFRDWRRPLGSTPLRKKTRSIAAHDPTPKNQLQVALMNFLPSSSSSSSSRLSCFWAQGAPVGLPSALAVTPRKPFFGHSVGFCQW